MTEQDVKELWEFVRKQERWKSPFWEQIAGDAIVILLEQLEKGITIENPENWIAKVAKRVRQNTTRRESKYIPVVEDKDGLDEWTPLDQLPTPRTHLTPETYTTAIETLNRAIPNWRDGLTDFDNAEDGPELYRAMFNYARRVRRALARRPG